MTPIDNTNDANDDVSGDDGLQNHLQSSALPGAPVSVGKRVQQRIAQRVFQQRAVLAASLLALTLSLGLLVLPKTEQPKPAVASGAPLDDDLLATLFAPPPVESLAALERRQQFAVQALQQLEKNRP